VVCKVICSVENSSSLWRVWWWICGESGGGGGGG
jgi:hypothetical protein